MAVLYESLSIILQRWAIAYWWGRNQYGTGRFQYGRCRLWIFPTLAPRFCVTRALESGARLAEMAAALADKSTSVADGEGVGKSPMMRAFLAARSFSLAVAPPCA
ncbi:hypothetical protein [Pseudomonas sp. NPDC089401]|uniref:hypothetical protein n=1 Tax=Pseudomonas sp. NPDC089401 TaxID=3364462 RepID=UPI003803A966